MPSERSGRPRRQPRRERGGCGRGLNSHGTPGQADASTGVAASPVADGPRARVGPARRELGGRQDYPLRLRGAPRCCIVSERTAMTHHVLSGSPSNAKRRARSETSSSGSNPPNVPTSMRAALRDGITSTGTRITDHPRYGRWRTRGSSFARRPSSPSEHRSSTVKRRERGRPLPRHRSFDPGGA